MCGSPMRKEFLARSASCSMPIGTMKGDLELKVAAIVNAGSRQRSKIAVSRNFPNVTQRCVSEERQVGDELLRYITY